MGGIVFCVVILSGLVDAYRAVIPRIDAHQMYSREEMALADWVKENTSPDSIWLTGTHHNHWLFNLTGRQTVMTYPGWLWSQGLPYYEVEKDVRAMYGDPAEKHIFEKYGIDFAVVGPVERRNLNADPEKFRSVYPTVLKTERYWIFAISKG